MQRDKVNGAKISIQIKDSNNKLCAEGSRTAFKKTVLKYISSTIYKI